MFYSAAIININTASRRENYKVEQTREAGYFLPPGSHKNASPELARFFVTPLNNPKISTTVFV